MNFCNEFIRSILEDKFLRNILDYNVYRKFTIDGYLDIFGFSNEIFVDNIKLTKLHWPLMPMRDFVLDLKKQVEIKHGDEKLVDDQLYNLRKEDLVRIVNRIVQILYCMEDKYEQQDIQYEIFFDFTTEYLLERYNGKIKTSSGYITINDIELVFIDSLEKFVEVISKINFSSDESIFFRGHSNVNYHLIPSILRSTQWYQNEDVYYHAITRMCPKTIYSFTSHIDRLVEMQHYELPTRLLDITTNALVALLFATKDSKRNDGEVIVFKESTMKVKYGNSDTVAILSSLPVFTLDEKEKMLNLAKDSIISRRNFNRREIIQRLLHEIKAEKPAFRDIINPDDINEKIVIALPSLLNDRIIKQSGAFIITGLVNYKNRSVLSEKLNNLRYRKKSSSPAPIYIISANSKEQIMRNLKLCDLTEATVFPEIDKVAQYLKNNDPTN